MRPVTARVPTLQSALVDLECGGISPEDIFTSSPLLASS